MVNLYIQSAEQSLTIKTSSFEVTVYSWWCFGLDLPFYYPNIYSW